MKGKAFADRIRRISMAIHEPQRMALQYIRKDKLMPLRARMLAQRELDELPISSCFTRLVRRCTKNNRGTSVIPAFNIGRHAFREEALAGRLLGVTKSCW
jgi:ribosomal protein S14